MEVFGIIGMSLGFMGFIFGIFGVIAFSKANALEKKLNDAGVLDTRKGSTK